uniref:Uncharacterized protein n=1 Tax=Anopheles melas TaxID=34690 RepID=A0A182TGJ4_9DIPT
MEGEYTPESCGDQQAHRADSDLLAGSTPRRGGVHKSETPTILSPAAGPSKSRREDPLQDDQRVEPLAYSTLRQNGGRSASPPGEPKDAYLASWYELEMEKLQLERKELEVLKRELALREMSFRQRESERKKVDEECEAPVFRIQNGDAAGGHRHDNVGRAVAPAPPFVEQHTTIPTPTMYREYAEWRNAVDRSYQLGHPSRIAQT